MPRPTTSHRIRGIAIKIWYLDPHGNPTANLILPTNHPTNQVQGAYFQYKKIPQSNPKLDVWDCSESSVGNESRFMEPNRRNRIGDTGCGVRPWSRRNDLRNTSPRDWTAPSPPPLCSSFFVLSLSPSLAPCFFSSSKKIINFDFAFCPHFSFSRTASDNNFLYPWWISPLLIFLSFFRRGITCPTMVRGSATRNAASPGFDRVPTVRGMGISPHSILSYLRSSALTFLFRFFLGSRTHASIFNKLIVCWKI